MTMNKKFRDVISKIMESATLDEEGNLKVLDEKGMKEADAKLEDIIVEAGRQWWSQLESVEDDLGDMKDEISFGEMNADPSSINSDDIPIEDDDELETVESILGEDDFDLNSIFEMDDEEEFSAPTDGDEEFDDFRMGLDDDGIGDDGDLDGTGDEADDDLDVIGDEDEGEFDAEGDLGDEEDLGDEGLGDDEFDLSVLDDEEFGGDDEALDLGGDDEGFDLGSEEDEEEFGGDDEFDLR